MYTTPFGPPLGQLEETKGPFSGVIEIMFTLRSMPSCQGRRCRRKLQRAAPHHQHTPFKGTVGQAAAHVRHRVAAPHVRQHLRTLLHACRSFLPLGCPPLPMLSLYATSRPACPGLNASHPTPRSPSSWYLYPPPTITTPHLAEGAPGGVQHRHRGLRALPGSQRPHLLLAQRGHGAACAGASGKKGSA